MKDETVKKAIFLDRDGTINVERDYLFKISDFEFLPGAIDALHSLQAAGFLLIIITNQSGIARGYYTLEDYEKLNGWMLNELERHDVRIEKVYYCPHHPNATVSEYRIDCDCRKPKLGMYKQAIGDYHIDLSRSFAIGDKIRDCSICESTECRGFLIANNEKSEIINAVKAGMVRNVEYAEDLRAAVNRIVES